MNEILERAYASAPVDEVIYNTLEFRHPALPGGVIRIVRGCEDITARLESGEWVEFEASGAEWVPPSQDNSGAGSFDFAIGNVDGTVQCMIDAVDAWQQAHPFDDEALLAVARDYLASDLSAPQLPPAPIEVRDARMQLATANITAEAFPVLSMAWPCEHYTTANTPGLRYL